VKVAIRAAEGLRSLVTPLGEVIRRAELRAIPGIGDARGRRKAVGATRLRAARRWRRLRRVQCPSEVVFWCIGTNGSRTWPCRPRC